MADGEIGACRQDMEQGEGPREEGPAIGTDEGSEPRIEVDMVNNSGDRDSGKWGTVFKETRFGKGDGLGAKSRKGGRKLVEKPFG